jgi:prepilin-type N-terminal cleavage/methylation domain-containing protein
LRQTGYTLVELLVVLIILGIISAVAVRSLQKTVAVSRTEETKAEMESLAYAIAGNPSLVSNGVRSDYGYVGDVGALPPTLTALSVNPGSYAAWHGPYTQDKVTASVGVSSSDISQDAWGAPYSYSPLGATITSAGNGSAFTRPIANSAADLLVNQVSVSVTDLSGKSPGTTYDDSIRILLTIPNGIGGTTSIQRNPSSGGWAQFDSIPIGTHALTVVYLPYSDTLQREVHVDPGHLYSSNVQLFRDFPGSVGGGEIVFINNSDSLTGGVCEKLTFWITNTGSATITVTSMTLTWSSPASFYKKLRWGNVDVWDEDIPRNGSGDIANFSPAGYIDPGQSLNVYVEEFKDQPTGGNNVEVRNTSFTVLLSDGSTLTFTTDNTCY